MINKTPKYYCLFVILIVAIHFVGCGRELNIENEKQILLLLHKEQQDAHLNKNAKQFVDQFANPMLSIKHGKIDTIAQDAAIERFQNYFNSVIIKSWEDITPPIIDLSEDATMAYMVVEKLVVLSYEDEEGKTIEEKTHFAWVSVFKKQENGEWKIVCNISTNEPNENE